MKSTIKNNTTRFLMFFLGFILLIPLNNLFEVQAMMAGRLTSWREVLTPFYLKGIKDIFLVLCMILLLVGMIKAPNKLRVYRTPQFLLLHLFTFLLILSAVFSITYMPAELVLMGIRGYWSLGLVYVAAIYWDFDEERIYPYLLSIFGLHLVMQLWEFVTDVGYDVYFQHRSPGLFIVPSTAGAFAVLIYYVAIRKNSAPLKLLAFGSVILSNSTEGILVLVTYYIYTYRTKFRPKLLYYPMFFVCGIVFAYFFMQHIGQLTGRGSGASYSALTRIGILYVALSNSANLILGRGLGIATSQALISGYSGAIIADNTYVGIMYNLGLIAAILMFIFILSSYRSFESKLLFFLLFGYSMTTVIFEINPVVQIVLILLGSQIGRSYSRRALTYSQREESGARIPYGTPKRNAVDAGKYFAQ